MPKPTVLVLPIATGLLACTAFAGPAELAGQSGSQGVKSLTARDWIHAFIADFAGPSNKARVAGDSVNLQASEHAYSFMLHQLMAGPSNVPSGPRLTRSLTAATGSPDSPGDPYFTPRSSPAPLIISVQQREVPPTVTPSTSSDADPGTGGFQVVVPLPGAGAMAAAGLLVVAIRRRRA